MSIESHEANPITPFAITDWRDIRKLFGIKMKDRMMHMYTIGRTGTGKSTLLENIAIHDIQHGNGIALIDPHGDMANHVLDYVPEERIEDVIYFNATDTEHPIGFNPLYATDKRHHHLIASELIATFKKIWADFWGPRLEYILRYAILTLLEYGDATLLDIQPLLAEPDFRKEVLSHIRSPQLLSFWLYEYEKYSSTFRNEAIAPILNKVGLFASHEILRNIIGQKEQQFSIKDSMDNGKILICNLSKGIIGEDACSLLGSMLVTAIQVAALQRADRPVHERKPFYLFVDELQSFLSLSFADILAEARKYSLSLFMANQSLQQLQEPLKNAILSNVGTLIAFRVGVEDAEVLQKEFYPIFDVSDLINLPRYSIYLKLMIDGTVSKPFSATTIPLAPIINSHKGTIIQHSAQKYGKASIIDKKENYGIVHKKQEQTSLFEGMD